jgi:deazaflavin-dependent oxidoreductase (nitroreductase family)
MNGSFFVKFLLRSPLHRVMSGNTMLITVTGRKTGRPITTPVNYAHVGDTLWVISRRDRNWWRNVRGGAPVKLHLRGHDVDAFAEAVLDEQAVKAHLGAYLRQILFSARSLGIRFNNGDPDTEDLARTAREWLMVCLKL